jgi:Flp pilus assembly protein TadG
MFTWPDIYRLRMVTLIRNCSLANSLKRFRRDKTAATAVEFGLVAFPFFIVVMFTIELSYDYYLQQMLDISLSKIAINVRNGTVQTTGNANNASKFYTNYVGPSLDSSLSSNALAIDVMQVFTTTTTTTSQTSITDAINFTNGDNNQSIIYSGSLGSILTNLTTTGNIVRKYCPGKAGDYIVIQAAYLHQNFTPLMNLFFKSTSDTVTGAKLTASVMFKNEYFSGTVLTQSCTS